MPAAGARSRASFEAQVGAVTYLRRAESGLVMVPLPAIARQHTEDDIVRSLYAAAQTPGVIVTSIVWRSASG